jgi:hypothetical protein
MDNSNKELNKDAASFESKEPPTSIFGFSPIDEHSDLPKDSPSDAPVVPGLTEQQNLYLAQ